MRDIELLEELELLLEGQVGRVARGVGQRTRRADGADELLDAAIGSPQVEDLVDHGAVLALELDGPVVVGVGVGQADGGGAELTVRALFDIVGPRAVQPADRGRDRAAWKLDALDHVGERADLGGRALDGRDEQDLVLVAGVDREGGRRVGEGHDVVGEDDEGLLIEGLGSVGVAHVCSLLPVGGADALNYSDQ